jgi:RNA-binding protein
MTDEIAPISLSGKQKRILRARGQSLQPALIVGREGLTDAVRAELEAALSRRELIKVRLSANLPDDRKEFSAYLAGHCGCALAGVVGRTALLYRPNEDLPEPQRIELG